jgi:hypothetical protein
VAVAPLAATVLGLGLSTGTAGAASRSRTDTVTFTNRAGDTVTCTLVSSHDIDETGRIRASTTLSGPADCTGSPIRLFVRYGLSNGESQSVEMEGEGRSLVANLRPPAVWVESASGVTLSACGCTHGYGLRQSK